MFRDLQTNDVSLRNTFQVFLYFKICYEDIKLDKKYLLFQITGYFLTTSSPK